MKFGVRLLSIALAAAGLASLGFGQSLLDVAFNSGQSAPSGAAVLGAAGDQWNAFDASGGGVQGSFPLFDNMGNATSVGLTFSCDGAVPAANPPSQPDPDLTHYYMFDNSGGALTVTLTGLSASQEYDLVLYVASDDASGGDRSLTGTVTGLSTVPFSATGDPQSTFIDGENIVHIHVTSDASGNLSISEGDGATNSSGEVDMSGLQLAPVPEPITGSMLLIGAIGLISRRRKLS